MRLRLTGYLLDLVDHHEGIRQAHLHRVIDRTDLGHLNRDLGGWGWGTGRGVRHKKNRSDLLEWGNSISDDGPTYV